MSSLGGPREGNCHVESWLMFADDVQLPETKRDDVDHGVWTWADFLGSMQVAGASRPTYDLFDVPQPSGLIRRYRAYSV